MRTLSCDVFADLFLIRPPPDSVHQAVNPAHILISGDSAGGGLSLALLQVIRDSGLPPPAGGILVSPWCDLSHSFPSIHLNTKTVCILTGTRFPSLFFLKPRFRTLFLNQVYRSISQALYGPHLHRKFQVEFMHHFDFAFVKPSG